MKPRLVVAVCAVVLLGNGLIPLTVMAAPEQRSGITVRQDINHGGRTDKNGCHVDRKTGIRHCH